MPLRRDGSGNLGVDASGSGGGVTMVVNIQNNTNSNVETSQSNQNGMPTMDIIISQIDSGMATRAARGQSQLVSYIDKSRGLSAASQLYR